MDGSGDQYIVREAGNFWRERGMRAKIDETIPEHKQHDDTSRHIGDEDACTSHGELPHLDDDEAGQRDADDHCEEDGEDNATAVAGQDDADPAVVGASRPVVC